MVDAQPEFKAPIHINNQGFRDKKAFTQKNNHGVIRMAALGDSFTFGTGVRADERASDLLEQKLSANTTAVEVYNFGLPASSTASQIDILRNHIIPLKPDVLLIMFYMGNDVIDNYHQAVKHTTAAQPAASKAIGLFDQIRYRSMLYQFLLYKCSSLSWFTRAYDGAKSRDLRGEIGRQWPIFDTSFVHQTGLWKPTHAAIRNMVTLAKAHNIEPILVLLPTKVQYSQTHWSQFASSDRVTQRELSQTYPNEQFAHWARKTLQIPVIDPLPRFQEAADEGAQIYYPINGHWTATGHAILADALYAYFEEEHRP